MGVRPPQGCVLTPKMFETLGWLSTRRPITMEQLQEKIDLNNKRSTSDRLNKLKALGLVKATSRGRGAGWLLTEEGFSTYKQEFEARYG